MYQPPNNGPTAPLPNPIAPPPPVKPPRKKMRRGCFISLIVAAVLLVAFIALAAYGSTLPPAPTAAATATSVPTQATVQPTSPIQPTSAVQPTDTPTAKPTSIPPSSGPALLGSDIGAFIASYGQPNDHTDAANGQYHFARLPGENTDGLLVNTDITDGNAYLHRVQDITVAAPTGGWSMSVAHEKCGAFFPRDAVVKQQIPTQNGGIDYIYYSASLASLFPASSFVDAQQNPVKAGTFDVLYLYTDASQRAIDDCDMIIGEQQTT